MKYVLVVTNRTATSKYLVALDDDQDISVAETKGLNNSVQDVEMTQPVSTLVSSAELTDEQLLSTANATSILSGKNLEKVKELVEIESGKREPNYD